MKNIFLGLILLIACTSFAQHTVSGVVLDANTEEPVIGATIYLQKPEKGTITDLEGNFAFNNLSEGSYKLIVSSLGYGTRDIAIDVPVEENLRIELTPTAIEMEEVIISTPFHQLQSDNVMKVERVTMAELNREGNLNLSQGLSKIAGVETVTTGTAIGKPVIRGLSSNRVLVYAQGVRLENQQFGDEHGLGVNSSGVESVEVIKGPASLLYGSDALGGVLYLNPERYAPADSTLADAELTYYTNTEGMEANAGFKTSRERLQFLLRGNYAAHSDYETGNDLRVTNTRFREWDLKTGLGYETDTYKGDLRYNLNNSKAGIPETIGEQTTSKELVAPYQWVQNHILSLDNTFYLDNSSLDLKFGYLFNNRQEFEEEHEEHEEETEEEHELHMEGEPALEMHLETLNYDLKYHFPKRRNFETIIGLQGMYQTNRNLGEEVLIPDANTTDVGILATTHYHLDKYDFQAGIRYDHRYIATELVAVDPLQNTYIQSLERSFNSYNGALGAKVDLTHQSTLRLNFATGFRAPNLAELTSYGSHHGTNRFEIGDPDLENEQNYQLDLALEHRNAHFEAFLNGFYNRIQNYIFLDPTGDFINEDPVFEYEQSDAKLYGGEAGIHIHPHPLDWLHVESSYELVIGKQDNGNYLPLIPAASVLNTLRLELPARRNFSNIIASLSLKTVFEQNNTSIFETESSGYSLLNAGIGSSMDLGTTLLEFRLSGTNLLNKTYIAHLSRLKPEGIANMGRNISVSLGLSF